MPCRLSLKSCPGDSGLQPRRASEQILNHHHPAARAVSPQGIGQLRTASPGRLNGAASGKAPPGQHTGAPHPVQEEGSVQCLLEKKHTGQAMQALNTGQGQVSCA